MARRNYAIRVTLKNIYCYYLITEQQMWLNFLTKLFMVLRQDKCAQGVDDGLGDSAATPRPGDGAASISSFSFSWIQTRVNKSRCKESQLFNKFRAVGGFQSLVSFLVCWEALVGVGWCQDTPAPQSQLLKVCEPADELLEAHNHPWWEYLHHGNGRTLQITRPAPTPTPTSPSTSRMEEGRHCRFVRTKAGHFSSLKLWSPVCKMGSWCLHHRPVGGSSEVITRLLCKCEPPLVV